MVTTTRMTLDEFLALPETKPYREYIHGEVYEKPMPNREHAELCAELIALLRNYLVDSKEGRVYTELRHIERQQDWVYLPDINVTLAGRLGPFAAGPEEIPPDFAIEVLSPDDRYTRIAERVDYYMRSGVRLLWLVDPEARSIAVYRRGEAPSLHRTTETIDAKPVLRDFNLDLAALFAVLD